MVGPSGATRVQMEASAMNLRQHLMSLWRALRTRPAARGTPRRRKRGSNRPDTRRTPATDRVPRPCHGYPHPRLRGPGLPVRRRGPPRDLLPQSKFPILGSAPSSAPGQKGSNHVLTAAHLFYRPDLGGYATKAIRDPGQNGPNFKPFGTAAKTLTAFYPGWFAHNKFNYDDDLVVIGKINHTFANSFGYEAAPSQPKLLLNTAGYPEDQSANGTYMYRITAMFPPPRTASNSRSRRSTPTGSERLAAMAVQPLTNQSFIDGVISHESSRR